MRPLQALLFYAWGVLGFAALLGVPPETLTAAATVGIYVSAVGLAVELFEG